MIRIGDFSKLSCVTVKALRFYDEMGLLKPVSVDPYTGYRYYEFDQLLRVNRILALKDLGFLIEEIGQLLAGDLTPEQMRGMLKLRQADLRLKVQEESERLERVEARLKQIEQENHMPHYDIVIKKVEPILAATVRGVVPTPPEQGPLWHDLDRYLRTQHVRPLDAPCLTVYYDDEYRQRDWDLEVCAPLENPAPDAGRVKVRTLEGVEMMACTIHRGPFTGINDAYKALARWVDANGYRVCGHAREVYLRSARPAPGGVSQTDPETVTEIQYPVEKA